MPLFLGTSEVLLVGVRLEAAERLNDEEGASEVVASGRVIGVVRGVYARPMLELSVSCQVCAVVGRDLALSMEG